MRYETKTVRVGEKVAEIDWSYDFRKHFDNMCSGDEPKEAAFLRSKDMLKKMEDAVKSGRPIRATTDGGWPRFGWHIVADVGMYDGWPYWTPTPSVMLIGPLGAEWRCFSMVMDIDVEKSS
jgi:hypothetical protein